MKKNQVIKAELYRLGELSPAWEKDLDKDSLRENLKMLEDSDRAILEKYKPEDMARQIKGKMEKSQGEKNREIPFTKPSGKSRMMLLIPAAAMILFSVLLPTMILRNDRVGDDREFTRVKGMEEPRLKVYRKLEGESEELTENSSAAESDLIQLGYRISSPRYGMILSIDGRGVVTRHFPEEDNEAVLLKTGGEQLLPFSYELDDAPDFETFYLITSEEAFSAEKVVDTIAGAARKNEILLNIPEIMSKSIRTEDFSGKIEQVAVPVKKEE